MLRYAIVDPSERPRSFEVRSEKIVALSDPVGAFSLEMYSTVLRLCHEWVVQLSYEGVYIFPTMCVRVNAVDQQNRYHLRHIFSSG